MVVKIMKRLKLLYSFIVIAFIAEQCYGIQECKVELLKYFGMAPLKYPINNTMVICGNITENCCSMEDEIRIYRLWKRFSISQINKHVDQMVKNYATLFAYHDELMAVDFNRIEIKQTENRKIPFKFKVCERIAYQLDEEEKVLNSVDLLNNSALLDDPNLKQKIIQKKISFKNNTNINDLPGINDANINGMEKESRELQQTRGRILETSNESQKEESAKQIERKLRVILQDKKHYNRNKKASDKLVEVDKQLKQSLNLDKSFKLLTQQAGNPITEHTISKAPSNIQENNNEIQRGLKLAQLPSSNNPNISLNNNGLAKSTKKKRSLADDRENSFSRPFIFEEELPERKVQCTYLDRVVAKRVTVFNKYKQEFCSDLKTKLTKFKISDFKAYVPDVKIEMIRLMNLKKSFYCYLCDIEQQKRIDAENSIVTFDAQFCRRLVIDFRDYIKFQNVLLIEYIDMVLQYVRCFQTTADEARFPYASFLLMYQKNFETIQNCYDNVDKPDFMKYCIYICQQYSYTTFSKFFDGNPDLINRILMTLTSFFRKLRANQALSVDYKTLKKEFDLIDAVDFNMDMGDLDAEGTGQHSHESDKNSGGDGKHGQHDHKNQGDSKHPKHANANHGNSKKTTTRKLEDEKEYNLEASKISKMSKEQYHNYMIEKTYNQSTKISWEKEPDEGHTSIYETRAPHKVSKVFRSRFLNDYTALDPLEIEPKLNFDINIKTLIKLQCDKQRKKGEKPEILQREVINEYFSSNDDDIENFATDLFMPFTDYAFFHQDKNAPVEKKVIL